MQKLNINIITRPSKQAGLQIVPVCLSVCPTYELVMWKRKGPEKPKWMRTFPRGRE